MALVDMTVRDFLEQLASPTPTPGGGSASAVAGAMATAMVEMACNLTVGREKFRDVEEELQGVLARATELRQTLTAAIDEDTEAYTAVSEAYKLPKVTDQERAERTAAIQKALQYASEVPLKIAQAADETYDLAVTAVQKSNPNVASDARVAMLLAEAARSGGIANVQINLNSITDNAFANRMRDELKAFGV